MSDTADSQPPETARITGMTREFRYAGLVIPDPNPEITPDGVREVFAGTYPELATASVKGPAFEGSKMVYQFLAGAGVKG